MVTGATRRMSSPRGAVAIQPSYSRSSLHTASSSRRSLDLKSRFKTISGQSCCLFSADALSIIGRMRSKKCCFSEGSGPRGGPVMSDDNRISKQVQVLFDSQWHPGGKRALDAINPLAFLWITVVRVQENARTRLLGQGQDRKQRNEQ